MDNVEQNAALDALKEAVERVDRHIAAGRHEAALDLVASLEADHGELAPLHHQRGKALAGMGQVDAALKQIEAAMELDPSNGGYAADMGAFLGQQGRIDEALPYFEKATELAPNYAGAWTNLGAAYFLKGEHSAAIPHLRKAVELHPSLLDAQRNLGISLTHAHRFGEAVDVFYRALVIDPNDIGTHVHLSGALYRMERHDSAIHHAEKALELAPDALEPHLHLGNAKASLGRMEEAEAHLMKAASRMPAGIGALSRLIHLRKTEADSPEFRALKALEDRLDQIPPARRTTLHMAAGKAYADLGDAQASFHHLAAGNAITAEDHPFDMQNHVEQVDRMIAVVTPEFVAANAGAGIDDVAPIFICGMPRSGTTLMEQMLSRHSLVQAGGEMGAARAAIGQVRRVVDVLEDRDTGPITADDMTQIGEHYVQGVRANGITAEVLTDKMPINFLYVGLLALALPRAKFVILRRHPMDCCLSNWTQDFGRNQPFSTDLRLLGQVYMQYVRMSDYWAELMPDRVRIVGYEDVIADQQATMRGVTSFCGLAWEDGVLDHVSATRPVNTASVGQVRQPLYDSSVAKWRSYGALLKPLAEEVAALLSQEDRETAGLPRMA